MPIQMSGFFPNKSKIVTNLWKRLTSTPLGAKDSEGDRNIFQQSSELSSLKSEFAIQWENCERKF